MAGWLDRAGWMIWWARRTSAADTQLGGGLFGLLPGLVQLVSGAAPQGSCTMRGPALGSSIQLGMDTQQPAHNVYCARCRSAACFPGRRPAPPFAKRPARVVTAAPATSQERGCRPGREGQAHAGGPSPSWPGGGAGCGWQGNSCHRRLTPPEHALGGQQRERVAQVEAHGRAKLAVRACSRNGGWEGGVGVWWVTGCPSAGGCFCVIWLWPCWRKQTTVCPLQGSDDPWRNCRCSAPVPVRSPRNTPLRITSSIISRYCKEGTQWNRVPAWSERREHFRTRSGTQIQSLPVCLKLLPTRLSACCTAPHSQPSASCCCLLQGRHSGPTCISSCRLATAGGSAGRPSCPARVSAACTGGCGRHGALRLVPTAGWGKRGAGMQLVCNCFPHSRLICICMAAICGT